MIKVYSTGCPKCKVLLSKLDSNNVEYIIISDISQMESEGITTVPVIETDGIKMNFKEAIDWVNTKGDNK